MIETAHEHARILPYRSLAEFNEGQLQWFWKPYIPAGILTLLVGDPCSGKSSLLAWLCSRAKMVLLFPGREESFVMQTLPRLKLYPETVSSVQVVDGGDWYLPDCATRLKRLAAALHADLIVMDPVSSYMKGGSKNDEEFVRSSLEVLSEVAAATGAACVGVRHPGKAAGNVMMGSGEWRNVPKSIVQLLYDPSPPTRRMIRLYKDSFGQGESTRNFGLEGDAGSPLRFVLGDPVGGAEAGQIARLEDDLERSKFLLAKQLLAETLADERQLSSVVYGIGLAERISERTLYRAAAALGIIMEREGSGPGHKCYWSLPPLGGVSAACGGSGHQPQVPSPNGTTPQELHRTDTPAMTPGDTPHAEAEEIVARAARKPARAARKPARAARKPARAARKPARAEEVDHE